MPRSTTITILLAVFWLCLIVTLLFALSPYGDVPRVNDKTLHVLAFATLTFLATAAFPAMPLTRVFLGLCTLGGAIEIAQMIPQLHRDAEIGDWLADTLAIAVVLGVIRLTGFRQWWASVSLASDRGNA